MNDLSTNPSRRTLLKSVGGVALAGISGAAGAHSVAIESPAIKRRLKFYNTHTRESLDIVYRVNDEYIEDNLTQLYLLLRDHRQNEAMVIDEKLFDRLWVIQQELGTNEVIDIISGYRSPTTNAMLREKSSKVAVNSFHMKGRAIDLRMRRSSLESVRNAALSLKEGGVGYYPSSLFIHLDTGPNRSWIS